LARLIGESGTETLLAFRSKGSCPGVKLCPRFPVNCACGMSPRPDRCRSTMGRVALPTDGWMTCMYELLGTEEKVKWSVEVLC
jgi:hypothetical protein